MNETTLAILSGFPPVFAVIAIGYGARASGLLPETSWAGVNQLNYRVLLPAVLFVTLAGVDLAAPGFAAVALCAFIASLAAGVIGLAAGLGARLKREEAAALVIVSTGWNLFFFLALSDSVFGPEARRHAVAALAAGAIAIPILATLAAAWGARRPGLDALLKSPVLLGALAGVLAAPLDLPERAPLLMAPLEILSAGALGVILLAIGGGLRFVALKGRTGLLARAALARSLAAPAAFIAIGWAAGLRGEPLGVLALAGGAPGAAFLYALIREHDGPADLAAGMITASVLASAVLLPGFTLAALAL